MALAKKLLHTRYRVNDLEQTVEFYKNVLGLEEVRRHKADSTHVLEYPRWPDFSRRLAGLDKVWPS